MRLALPLAFLVVVVGCHEPSPPVQSVDVAPGPSSSASSTASAAPVARGAGLLTIGDDPTATDEARCRDVFAAFRTRIHPGDSAAQVAAVLGTPTWIGSDRPVDVVGGHVPVAMSPTDQVVVFFCLPKPDPRTQNLPWSRWAVYARLEGRASSTFGAFLAGGGSPKLLEYALCDAKDGQSTDCEHFPKRGP